MNSGSSGFCRVEQRIERIIEIYEYERLWLGLGFSKSGLLPSECGPYSTVDGSLNWNSIQEASQELLLCTGGNEASNPLYACVGVENSVVKKRGWAFHEVDEHVRADDNIGLCGFVPVVEGPTDVDGWSYMADFTPQSILKRSKTKGVLDFARRRMLRRTAVFRPDHFLPKEIYSKCAFCDSKAAALLSEALIQALAAASLYVTRGINGEDTPITDAKMIPLKIKIIDELAIGHSCVSTSLNSEYSSWSSTFKARDRLAKFPENSVGKIDSLKQYFNPEAEKTFAAAMPERKKAISNYFPLNERLALARLFIKDVDQYAFQLHCWRVSCNPSNIKTDKSGTPLRVSTADAEEKPCEFQAIECHNHGCRAEFSLKYKKEHDDECGFKVISCSNGCGATLMRCEMGAHQRQKCIARPEKCPLAAVGCPHIVKVQDTAKHLNNNVDSHLILLCDRLVEYQKTVQKLTARIDLLEGKNAQLEGEVKKNSKVKFAPDVAPPKK